jgi:uroporphyrinogen-III decarboxylase
MNKYKRVINVLDGKPVDKTPVSFFHHFHGEEGIGDRCVKNHIDFYRKSNIDFLKMMSDGFFDFPLGIKISKASDWNKINPSGIADSYISKQVERAKSVNDILQGDCCSFYNTFAPFSMIRFAVDDGMVMEHLREDPDAMLSALDVVAEIQIELARQLIEAGGCTGVYIPFQGGEKDRFTFDEYRSLITPSDTKLLDSANKFSDYNIIHLCGWAGVPNNLEVWQDYSSKAVNWAVHIEKLSLAEGKDFFPGKVVMGGFDNRESGTLYTGSKSEIKQYTQNLISETGNQGLIVSADCSLSADIDIDHINWVVEAVEEMEISEHV